MKILNFIPLLIWSLAFIPVATWSNRQDPSYNREDAKSTAELYIVGCIFWFVIGIVLLA